MNEHNGQRLLILGAAGKAGSRLCQQAVDAGYQVDAIVRDPTKLPPGLSGRINVIQGDLTDKALIQTVFRQGYHAVLSTLGIYHRTTATPLADITSDILDGMAAGDVNRFVCMSSVGTDDSKGQGSLTVRLIARIFLKYVLRDKSRQEKLITASALDWTIIRPPQLIDTDSRQDYSVWEGNRAPAGVTWKISNADAAAEMLRVINVPETFKKAFQVSYKS